MMKSQCNKLVGFWHYGVILTYLSVVSAIVGICFSVGGSPDIGIICLIISGICDAFDGAVASMRKNRTREDKMFGERIDSLSDVISFGVAPVLIGVGMGLNHWYYVPALVIYVLCALIRLAYYDVTEEIRTEDAGAGRRKSYEGLPVTCSAALIPGIYLIATFFEPGFWFRDVIMIVGYLVIALLFVLRFRVPKPRIKVVIFGMTVAFLVIVALFVLRYFFGYANLFIIV